MTEIPKKHRKHEPAPAELCYSGLFLSSDARQELLAQYPPVYPNVDAGHITVKYWAGEPSPPSIDTLSVGEVHPVPVIGYVVDEVRQVQAVLVDMIVPDKPYPHITISTGLNPDGTRVAPALSNDAIRDAVEYGTVLPVTEGTVIPMTTGYCLGYDRNNRTVVTGH